MLGGGGKKARLAQQDRIIRHQEEALAKLDHLLAEAERELEQFKNGTRILYLTQQLSESLAEQARMKRIIDIAEQGVFTFKISYGPLVEAIQTWANIGLTVPSALGRPVPTIVKTAREAASESALRGGRRTK